MPPGGALLVGPGAFVGRVRRSRHPAMLPYWHGGSLPHQLNPVPVRVRNYRFIITITRHPWGAQ
ncbi:hypothetical protein FFB58_13575 [Enterobacter sp. MF024]|nr:hypothetical protein FFB58_13575 [Enterobacter sp. MF024]